MPSGGPVVKGKIELDAKDGLLTKAEKPAPKGGASGREGGSEESENA